MEIIPAIDIRGGRCVRLYQGDYKQETVYSDDPLSIALSWQELGARRIHVVDLDGAASRNKVNLEIISNISSHLDIPIQVGGGIRDMSSADLMLKNGVGRVILGTIAVEYPTLVKEMCDYFGSEAIVVGVDTRGDMVSIRGWKKSTLVKSSDLVEQMYAIGVRRFVCTDITRDGTLMEPNFERISHFISLSDASILASGGISSLEDVQKLSDMGLEGAIIGKALYTGNISLEEAISVAN